MRLKYNENSINRNYDVSFHHNFIDYQTTHNHDFWEVLIVTGGSYVHNYNGSRFVMKAGDGFIIRPDDVHNIVENAHDSSHINIAVRREYFESFCRIVAPNLAAELSEKKTIRFTMLDFEIRQLLEKYVLRPMFDEPYDETIDINLKLVFSHLMLSIFDRILNVEEVKPQWLINLSYEMRKEENYGWKVIDVINASGYSRTQLLRIFDKYYHCTVYDYLIFIKINIAKEMLSYSDKTVNEISSVLGFASPSHFNHLFKKMTGSTPLRYRKNKK